MVSSMPTTRRGVVWLGLYCDVRCKFCYDEKLGVSRKRWVPLEDLREILGKFRFFYQNQHVDFMGGEPTIHPDVLGAVAYSSSIGLKPTVITHAMRLADPDLVAKYKAAGIHDFLVSIHGTNENARAIHGRGHDNFGLQMQALDNFRHQGIPFRFNVTIIRDNVGELDAIARLAADKGAHVVNFLTFNPYFEWTAGEKIPFQVSHSEAASGLKPAIDILTKAGIEANVRYMPICTMQGYEEHIFTGMQLPYDEHEWDYNSWYDRGYAGHPDSDWYVAAGSQQQVRHHYVKPDPCSKCALQPICDGVHAQYLANFGTKELSPYSGELVSDPSYFVQHQPHVYREVVLEEASAEPDMSRAAPLRQTQFDQALGNRAGIALPLTPRNSTA